MKHLCLKLAVALNRMSFIGSRHPLFKTTVSAYRPSGDAWASVVKQ